MKKKVIAIVTVVFGLGIMYSLCNKVVLKDYFFSVSYFYFFLNILIFLIAYGISFICIPVYFVLLIYELFSTGFITGTLILNFGLKGLLVSLVIILFKAVIVIMLILNSYYHLKYIKSLYNFLFKRIPISKHNTKIYTRKMTIISVITIIFMLLYILIDKYILIVLLNQI